MAPTSTISPKIIAILLIPVLLLVLLIGALYVFQAPIPSTMDLRLEKLDGSTIQTTSLKGKTLVVEFMATWCTYCKEISDNIVSVLDTNNYPNVMFISVTTDPTHDTAKVLNEFISENNFTSHVGSDWIFTRDLSEQYTFYGVSNVPHTFLVNANSSIIDQHLGYLSYPALTAWLNLTNPVI